MSWNLKSASLALVLIVCAPQASAQVGSVATQPSFFRAGTGQGQLTVILTVVPSVGVIMDDNGQPRTVIANAPDPADNVSSLIPVPKPELHQNESQSQRHGDALQTSYSVQ